MSPRSSFAALLGLGAGLHLAMLLTAPRPLSALALYLCWLVPSALATLFVGVGPQVPPVQQGRKPQWPSPLPPSKSPLGRDGLGLLLLIGFVGLLIHLIGLGQPADAWSAAYRPSPSSRRWTPQGALALIMLLCAAGCWGLLRGAPGDTSAPLPDDSRLVRGIGWLRRLSGLALAGWGAWLLLTGIRHWSATTEGFDRLLNLAFVISGPLFVLIGLGLALRRSRRERAADSA